MKRIDLEKINKESVDPVRVSKENIMYPKRKHLFDEVELYK